MIRIVYFITFVFSILAALLSIRLGYLWVAEGYGWHPVISGLVTILLACIAIYAGLEWISNGNLNDVSTAFKKTIQAIQDVDKDIYCNAEEYEAKRKQ